MDETKYLGVDISAETNNILHLYAAVNDMKRAELVRLILQNWVEQNGMSVSRLIDSLAERVELDWKVQCVNQKKDHRMIQYTKKQFLRKKRETMKVIPDHLVLRALQKCGYEKD